MEFEGQRGDAITPWSVGKHAKRSATIHLNSRDLVRPLDEHITSVIVGQDAAGLIFQDPKAVIRTALQAEPYSGEVRLVQSDAFTNPTFTIPALPSHHEGSVPRPVTGRGAPGGSVCSRTPQM